MKMGSWRRIMLGVSEEDKRLIVGRSDGEVAAKIVLTCGAMYATFATMKDRIHQIGSELVRSSAKAEFTAQRSIVDDLFPYIYLASRRMSLRAISRWLAAEHGIKLSDVAVARAMRNADKHWREMVEEIEPAARQFADAHDAHAVEVLSDEKLFEALEVKPPILDADVSEAYDRYVEAAGILRNRWFGYPEEVREQCKRHLGLLELEKGETRGKSNERRGRNKKQPR